MTCTRIQSEAGRATNAGTASDHRCRWRTSKMAKRENMGAGRPRHLSMQEVLDWSSMPEPNSGCQLWIKAASYAGYGQFSWGGKLRLAHRAAYELASGPIPSGLAVCHRCDVPSCVNPQHLFLGTPKENMGDASNKGRLVKGSRHLLAKITESDARAIASSSLSYAQLARQYGVSRTLIYRIKRGLAWIHALH